MKTLHYPPVLHWEVTPECNQNCIHCYNYWRKEPTTKNESIKNHLEIAEKIVTLHPVSLVVTGGEPLLIFDQIKDSLIMLRQNKISISINTNATLVTEDIAKFLKELDISAFVSLPCCDSNICDSITNLKDSLSKISKGIKTLKQFGVRVSVNMVVSNRNKGFIYETAKYAKLELGLDAFFASRVSNPINSCVSFDKELIPLSDINLIHKELLRIHKDFQMRVATAGPIPACAIADDEIFQNFAYTRNCTAGKISYSVDYSGKVKACARDSKIYGDILTDDFSEIWNRMDEWRDDSLLPKECKDCNVKSSCRGGCRLDAYPYTKCRNSLDPHANIENLPVKFVKQQSVNNIDGNAPILIPHTIHFIKESFGWRVNVGSRFMFITDEMQAFLDRRSKFCINEFMQMYNIDYPTANGLVNLLINNKILYIR